MEETFRLLRECKWLLEAIDDPDYPPHTLKQQKDRLEEQLDIRLAALEADMLWSSKGDDSVFLLPQLPDGWIPQILEPTRELRFTARSPKRDSHRLVVMAGDAESLSLHSHNYEQTSLNGNRPKELLDSSE